MKLAYVTAKFPFWPGEQFFEPEIRSLEALAEVTIVPIRPSGARSHYPELGAETIAGGLFAPRVIGAALAETFRAPLQVAGALGSVAFGTSSLRARIVNLAVFPKGLAVAREVRRRGIEHIHAQWLTTPATVAYVASRISGVPFSLSGHSHDLFAGNLLAVKIAHATFTRVVSRRNLHDLVARLPHELAERCHVVHLGVGVPQAVKQPPVRVARILCSARLDPIKGHHDLLAALALVRDRGAEFVCELAGDGELRAEIAAEIERLGLGGHVRMLGGVDHERLLASLAKGDYDLAALASLERGDEHEGIPVALMEAMAAGLPVVATRTGSVDELVDAAAGILVEQRDPPALAEALERLIRDVTLRRQLGEQARARIKGEFETNQTTRGLAVLLGIPTGEGWSPEKRSEAGPIDPTQRAGWGFGDALYPSILNVDR